MRSRTPPIRYRVNRVTSRHLTPDGTVLGRTVLVRTVLGRTVLVRTVLGRTVLGRAVPVGRTVPGLWTRCTWHGVPRTAAR
jgi:hypothetical protein